MGEQGAYQKYLLFLYGMSSLRDPLLAVISEGWSKKLQVDNWNLKCQFSSLHGSEILDQFSSQSLFGFGFSLLGLVI